MDRNGIRNYFFRVGCAVCAIAITPIGTGTRASAQTPSTDPSFEVATVKPVLMDASHPFNPLHYWAHVNSAGASYWSMTVKYLVAYAYGVEFTQVTGPEWTETDHFDIEAKFPEGADKKDDRRMLQALLKDRFKLDFHIEKRELEVYALVIGKHGEKLSPSLPDPAESENPGGPTTLHTGNKAIQTVTFDQEKLAQHWEIRKTTMEDLAKRLGICMDSTYHKVVDETGLKGTYQVAFDCPQPRPPRPVSTGAAGTLPSDSEDGSSLTRSLDALGLRLEKRKVPMDVYVIDHVEKPSAN